jgi:hypothetical protein
MNSEELGEAPFLNPRGKFVLPYFFGLGMFILRNFSDRFVKMIIPNCVPIAQQA